VKFGTKLRKLRRVSSREALRRAVDIVTIRRERIRWRGRAVSGRSDGVETVTPRVAAGILIPGASALRAAGVNASDALGKCGLAGHDLAAWPMLDWSADLTGTIDWHADGKSGYRWDPAAFYADLPLYHIKGTADVKYPWELSRHQYFFDLAVAAGDDTDDGSARRVREMWIDWIVSNPQYQGINWTSGLEAAMRSISWIWTLAVLRDWEGWRDGDLERIAQSLAEHASYLANHFSYFSSPYNHLIGEATALYLLSHILAEHPQAANWRHQARKTLLTYGPKQFYDDGFGVEQAVSYHYYTLGFLTQAIVAARRFDEPLRELEPVVHQAYQAGMPFRRSDGRWPAVGDLDSARALPVNPKDFWNFDGLCACGAVFFDDPSLIGPGAEAGAEVFWLFGVEGLEKWNALRAAEAEDDSTKSGQATLSLVSTNGPKAAADENPLIGDSADGGVQCVMPEAGYVIASDGNDWLLFDAGPIAAGLFADSTPSTAHGHADTLQVLYFADGQPLLDDGGIPFYNGNLDWIRYFRSARAHNAVEIEGVEVVHPEGRLAWSREVKRPNLSANLLDDAWLCCGRLSWAGVAWQRSLLCLPGKGLWIADRIETDRPRLATWYWQLPAAATSDTRNAASWDHFDLRRVSSDGDCEEVLTRSRDDRPEGLRCHGYGKKSPGAVLVQRQRVEERLLVMTSIGRIARPIIEIEWNGLTAGPKGAAAATASWQHADCRWSLISSNHPE